MEPPAARELRELAQPSSTALAAVVQAMRRIEARMTDAGRRRGQMLEECRQVLGATSIALCHLRQGGELTIASVAGFPPDTATVSEIAMRAATRSRDWYSTIQRGRAVDIAIAGRGADLVYAILPAGAQPWVEDFVAFVAERFIRSAARNVETGAPIAPSPSALALPPEMVIGPSMAMHELLEQMSATVSSGLDVLLSGETGTGKELLARAVHGSGPTRGGPFVAINCAAIPGELLEAELFGVERNVATGVDPRAGLFAEADGGSMFLDEIGELPERLQAKLLRVLQEREVLAIGAKRPRKISVRIISASNRNLASLAAEGTFRADLYYRLRGLEFHSPPLRERSEDIPALALEFLTHAAKDYGKHVVGITSTALDVLQAYRWPGNVRELQNEIRRAALMCPAGGSIDEKHFSSLIATPVFESAAHDTPLPVAPHATLRETIEAVERVEIGRALRISRGNRSLAARMLGITRNGLTHKLRRLGLEASE